MKGVKCIESDLMAYQIGDAKDELNLAEFPLCTLTTRLRPGQKTLAFEDRLWDKSLGAQIIRHLTVTGSDAYGLPTALDDEVLLGLIQLTKLRGFAERRVLFTRYQLIHILGWRNDGSSYARLENSLNRWTGVTLYYDNAWWNKAARRWMSEKFHILDNVWLCHRAERRPAGGPVPDDRPVSAFVWNDIVFRSFQAGNLKSIDFEFYKSLDGAVTRRLYRFLDKRFFHRQRWEFDLKELAWEHIGLARSYDSASLKRRLRPAILELERKGYLRAMEDHERFRKVVCGNWRVLFAKSLSSRRNTHRETFTSREAGSLVSALIERGVTPSTARETVRTHPPDRVRAQIQAFDWLAARRHPCIFRNPPGFLVSSIQRDFALPPGSSAPTHKMQTLSRTGNRGQQSDGSVQNTEALKRQREEQAVADYLQSLSQEERSRLTQDALAHAPRLQRRLAQQEGRLGEAAIQAALFRHALHHLNAAPQGATKAPTRSFLRRQ